MIRNLNQVNFRSFGSVLPERASSIFPFPKEAALSIHLDESVAPMYQAAADTWVAPGSGISVLSVSVDGETYQDFYLDKPVCLKAGAWFALSAFKGSAAVLLYAQDAGPDFLGTQTVKGLREDRQLHVDGIYTFF